MGRFNQLLQTLKEEPEESESAVVSQPKRPAKSSKGLGIDETPEPIVGPAESTLAIAQIVRDPEQVRKYFDPEKLESLAKTIAEAGVIEPLIVYALEDQPGLYQLIAGERRYRAAQRVGLAQVPVRIINQPSRAQILKIALIENLHHEDLNPIEQVEGILTLLAEDLQLSVSDLVLLLKQMDNDVRRQSHNVMGQSSSDRVLEVFESLGIKWRSFVVNQLPLLSLPMPILQSIREGNLAYTKALAIARLKQPAQQQNLLQEAITEDLSVQDIRDRIRQLTPPAQKKDDFPQRFTDLGKRLRQSRVWEDPSKKKQIEALMQKLETLLQDA
jgi:ParB family transcriptional regulator, chromosome partitioning protein